VELKTGLTCKIKGGQRRVRKTKAKKLFQGMRSLESIILRVVEEKTTRKGFASFFSSLFA
jgi:hypothetical protein